MAERIVVNTGPMVALARIELLDVIGQLPYEFITPQEVTQEIINGVQLGHPDARPPWLKSMTLRNPLSAMGQMSLDRGEAAVIQLALEQGIDRVCIDERRGRRAAMALNLNVTGTLGLLARARNKDLIPALRPHLEKLLEVGVHLNKHVIERALKELSED